MSSRSHPNVHAMRSAHSAKDGSALRAPRGANRKRAVLLGVALTWAASWHAANAHAQDVVLTSTHGLSPNYVWLAASATLITAGVGGLFALKVVSLHDQAEALPAVSPDRLVLRHQIEQAELHADICFLSALTLATLSGFLLFATDWSQTPAHAEHAARMHIIPVATARGAALVWSGVWL
jgi:hypothetical protein